jgi:hypothetical protein
MEVAPSSATVIIESCKKENEGSCEQLEECGGSAPLSANLENMVAGIQESMGMAREIQVSGLLHTLT